MGGCFSSSSSNTPSKDKTPVYYYCPRTLVEHEPISSTNDTSPAIDSVTSNLNSSNSDASHTDPTLLPYHEAIAKNENLKGINCKSKAFSVVEDESFILAAEEEDVCPTCFEEYNIENPRIITKCKHHFHMSCILEWRERSDTCPICDQMMIFDMGGE